MKQAHKSQSAFGKSYRGLSDQRDRHIIHICSGRAGKKQTVHGFERRVRVVVVQNRKGVQPCRTQRRQRVTVRIAAGGIRRAVRTV